MTAPLRMLSRIIVHLKRTSFSATNDPNLMGTINVVASEILKEVTPEIEAIKSSEMTRYQPGDVVGG